MMGKENIKVRGVLRLSLFRHGVGIGVVGFVDHDDEMMMIR